MRAHASPVANGGSPYEADPDAEILPGIRWGRPEWVPSPAFWAVMVARASEERNGFIGRDFDLAEAVGFCLLGGYGISAEINHAAYDRLLGEGVFADGRALPAVEIEALLRAPLNIGGRLVRYRFPRQRAHRIAGALEILKRRPPKAEGAAVFRCELMRIPGIGPKTASWIARNWLGSDEVAILDIHIVRAGILMGLFDRENRLPRDYEILERKFLEFSAALGAKPSLLDAVMWSAMRNIGRGPI